MAILSFLIIHKLLLSINFCPKTWLTRNIKVKTMDKDFCSEVDDGWTEKTA
jgi:hypothetical protein